MASRTAPLAARLMRRTLNAQSPLRATQKFPSCVLGRIRPQIPASLAQPFAIRAAHTIPRPSRPTAVASSTESSSNADAQGGADDANASAAQARRAREPHYQLTFTCIPCGHRSQHTVSKQGYHHGSSLITCPGCRNRHVISDHLGIFGDRKITVEDLMREKGQLVKRGSLGEDGDVEFWPDERYAEEGQQPKKDDS